MSKHRGVINPACYSSNICEVQCGSSLWSTWQIELAMEHAMLDNNQVEASESSTYLEIKTLNYYSLIIRQPYWTA